MKLNIWQEKYRPKKLDEMILSTEHRESFKSMLAGGEIPHLILSGAPGVGKTTIAKIFIKNLNCQKLVLNGSDSRGVGVIRDQIKDFVSTKSFQSIKIVFYDEGEALTPEAWQALKGVIETHSKRARFIFTTNFLYKIPEAIKSRCQIFEFQKLSKNVIIEYYRDILNKESIAYKEADIERVYKICNGDLRRSLNYLQKNSKDGRLVLLQDEYLELYKEIAKSTKSGQVKNLKEYFATHNVEWESVYRYIYERVDDVMKLATIGKYFYQHSLVVDPEINFVTMVCEIIKLK